MRVTNQSISSTPFIYSGETDGLAGDSAQVPTYSLQGAAAARYQATVADLRFPTPFATLGLSNSSAGGTDILASTLTPGTFAFGAMAPGAYSLLLFGEPGLAGAGFFSVAGDTLSPTAVPAPQSWLRVVTGLLGAGLMLKRQGPWSGAHAASA
jgi:hypothetical protein